MNITFFKLCLFLQKIKLQKKKKNPELCSNDGQMPQSFPAIVSVTGFKIISSLCDFVNLFRSGGFSALYISLLCARMTPCIQI